MEHARVHLNEKQEKRHQFAKLEEALWDKVAALPSAKKNGCHDAAARVMLNKKVRELMVASSKASEAIEKNEAALIEKTKEVEFLQKNVSTLQAQIRDMDCEIDVIVVEESCIRPQQLFTSFPIVPSSTIPLKVVKGRFPRG